MVSLANAECSMRWWRQAQEEIYSNMGWPRDYHPKWGMSDKDKYHDITYMWNLKNDINELIYKTDPKQTSKTNMVTKGKKLRGETTGVWN